MSDRKVICSHELVVRLDQYDDGPVSWAVKPDDAIETTSEASYEELVEAGAPLSALGIRALSELLNDGLVVLALEKANGYLWRERYWRIVKHLRGEDDAAEKTSESSGEAVVVH